MIGFVILGLGLTAALCAVFVPFLRRAFSEEDSQARSDHGGEPPRRGQP